MSTSTSPLSTSPPCSKTEAWIRSKPTPNPTAAQGGAQLSRIELEYDPGVVLQVAEYAQVKQQSVTVPVGLQHGSQPLQMSHRFLHAPAPYQGTSLPQDLRTSPHLW